MVPFLDLKAQYRSIKAEIDAAVLRVLASAEFALGSEVAGFEQRFAGYCGAKHCVALNSGTSALHLAMLAAGIGPGDEVISVPFTFVATIAAIEYAGARPVLVDVDRTTATMDPAQIERAITPRTKAIMPVHLHGQPADMDPILEIARKKNILVIEDAAQAHGAEYKGRRCGSLADIAAFSFYPGKNLGAYGEGGAVVTSNDQYAKLVRMMRDWGQEEKYHHVIRGFNYRMEGFQGAILGVKLKYLEQWTEARRAHARRYSELLAPLGIEVPVEAPNTRHVFHVYAIRVPDRDRVQKELQAAGIATAIHYPIPVHLQKAFAQLGYKPGDFPISEQLAATVLSLPMYPEMSEEQLREVVETVHGICRRDRQLVTANA
ncbi:MAG: DegT/DnrJ/EryC1/StrS family aminotransferase [Candidatus Korobacteraceae bacterium]